MNYLKKILRFAIPYKKYGILNIICNIFYALFSTLSMIAMMPMINVLFGQTDKVLSQPLWDGDYSNLKDYLVDSFNFTISQRIEIEGEQSALFLIVAIIVVLFLLKNLFSYLSLYFITFLRNGVLKDIRDEMFRKVVNLPISYFSEKRKGDTISRIASDVGEVQMSLLAVLELIIREPLTIIFAIISMLILSPKLTLFVFVFIPISGFIISFIGKSLKKKSHLVQNEVGQFLSSLEETLGGLKVIKGYNAEQQFENKFKSSTNRLYRFSNSLMNRQNLASPASEFLGILTIAAILLFGGTMVFNKQLDGGEFIVFLLLAYNILTPAKAISKALYSVKRGNASAERVLEILESESPIKDSANAKTKTEFSQGIKINNISFKYEDDLVLKNFTVNVPKGKTVALVGQSGSGKSTIANLVTRFYDVNEGSITIDSENIKDLTKNSLRGLMGLVTQDSILFNDTVKNNILIGKQGATDEQVIEALKIANAWEFVKDLPKGIETNVGDSGNKLSGGQKQRLSIARAVLKNPPIMILDEATSALDTESERLVQVALENMMKNRTSIVIAHRLSTIQNADEIIVMHKGEIAEQGKHNELMNMDGTYRKLVNMQSFD
ncbi:ABC transporter ATP-binding protein [Lacinutrix sp.]|uniref:ABC transporter ATP-binding protein n=1 Tax=Lacinutrix sp. TaxID=1937692 RepID=UPI0026125D4D|nr:ABC transporter ATP-binding protein [Lacinutrix sp.]MDG1715307.1 ABC transporter ATP-binding protein [Lacinutrix sp.]